MSHTTTESSIVQEFRDGFRDPRPALEVCRSLHESWPDVYEIAMCWVDSGNADMELIGHVQGHKLLLDELLASLLPREAALHGSFTRADAPEGATP